MHNPYEESYLRLLERHPNLDDYDWTKIKKVRKSYVHQFGWSIPSEEAVKAIIEFAHGRTIIDLGCGTGYWSSLFSQSIETFEKDDPYKCNIVAIDVHETFVCHYPQRQIMEGNAYLRECTVLESCLFLSWPEQTRIMRDPTMKTINFVHNFKGDRVVIVGEGSDGCTGWLDEDDDPDWILVKEMQIHQWPTVHDKVFFFARR